MPAADDQAEAGKNVLSVAGVYGGDAAGVDVGLQVVHGQQRLVDRHAEGLGRHQPDQQRPGQSGVFATATASISASVKLARWRVSWITGKMRSRCAREAISGTTPPKRWCSSSWEATTEALTSSRSVTIAAAVSSQVVSMVRRCMAGIKGQGAEGRYSVQGYKHLDPLSRKPFPHLSFFANSLRKYLIAISNCRSTNGLLSAGDLESAFEAAGPRWAS